jgi:hypothetical protein
MNTSANYEENPSLKLLIERGLIKKTPPQPQVVFFPDAHEWMWNYCVYLGSTECNGKQYDLGVFVSEMRDEPLSLAVVYDNQPGKFISGYLPVTNFHPFAAEFNRLMALYLMPAAQVDPLG